MTATRTQLDLACDRFPRLEPAIALLRLRKPSARAEHRWTYYGSTGCVRKARCAFCGRIIATCSAKWAETQTFCREADAHADECAERYLAAHGSEEPTLPMILDAAVRAEAAR